MAVARSWPVVGLCASCCFAVWLSASHAEEVADLLNEAHERYEQSIEEIEREAITRLDKLIERYADEGNLKKVLELRAQKTKLLEDRAWPESIVFRTMREKIRSARVRAKRELANAYEDAIAALTKERRYDDAVALREELDELTKIQASFDFRSEETEHKKPAKDGEVVRPANRSPAINAAKASAVAPALPNKEATGEPSAIDLAEFLASRVGAVELDSVLATSDQKRNKLNQLVLSLYMKLPPRQWTAEQLDDFVEFFSTAAMKADSSAFVLPDFAPDKESGYWNNVGGGGPSDFVRRMTVAVPSMQWLISSPTVDDFISRATHLQAKECWSAVNEQVNTDKLKLWLKSVGCNDAQSCREVLNKVREAGVRLAALDALGAELGE